jgi:hypothetical protein
LLKVAVFKVTHSVTITCIHIVVYIIGLFSFGRIIPVLKCCPTCTACRPIDLLEVLQTWNPSGIGTGEQAQN